jgi:hypothetical protein
MAINFIRVSPTGSAPSSTQQPLTFDNKLEKDLMVASCYRDDADLRHQHVLNAVYRQLFATRYVNTHINRTELITIM